MKFFLMCFAPRRAPPGAALTSQALRGGEKKKGGAHDLKGSALERAPHNHTCTHT
jgi:hypothetical protein